MECSGSPRKKLESVSTISDVVESLINSKKIIVITGAGISVSCGIPDFRSKEGLYNTLDCNEFNIPSAELLFDLEFFKIDPKPFYKFASSLLPNLLCQPSLTHRFISLLESTDKLLRNYTQNVDGLERKSGISRLVECHGSMDNFRCLKCRKSTLLEEIRMKIEQKSVPFCCCGGIIKPQITFFGEALPTVFKKQLKLDSPKCDMILVLGTSLKVHSILEVLKHAKHTVPLVLINRDQVKLPAAVSEGFDVELLGRCDDVIAHLFRHCFMRNAFPEERERSDAAESPRSVFLEAIKGLELRSEKMSERVYRVFPVEHKEENESDIRGKRGRGRRAIGQRKAVKEERAEQLGINKVVTEKTSGKRSRAVWSDATEDFYDKSGCPSLKVEAESTRSVSIHHRSVKTSVLVATGQSLPFSKGMVTRLRGKRLESSNITQENCE